MVSLLLYAGINTATVELILRSRGLQSRVRRAVEMLYRLRANAIVFCA